MSNDKVCKAWIEGKKAKSNSMSTDGLSLFSYKMKIGQTLNFGIKEVLNVQKPFFYSMTTSKHVGIAKSYCSRIVNPKRVLFHDGFWYFFP